MEYSKVFLCLLIVALFEGSSSTDCTSRWLTGECLQNFTSVGCLDVTCFKPVFNVSLSNMSASLCTNTCTSRGFYYTGLYNGTECRCANTPPCEGVWSRSMADMCGVPCSGDVTSLCGGRDAVQVYSYPGEHPVVGDWWFDGMNNIMECTGTNELNIVVATAVNGYNLTGSWQLDTWGSNSPDSDADVADRYHKTALSLDLRDIPIGSDLQTIQKEVRWYMDRRPSCDELGFLCVLLHRIGFSDFPNSTDPQPSCHEITCERNPHLRVKCTGDQCSCVDRLVDPTKSEEEILAAIEKAKITEETVDEVLEGVNSLSSEDFKTDAVITIANIIENVVSLNSTDTEVTSSVVAIIGNLMNSDPEALAAAQGMNKSSSRVMQALEHQLQVVDLTKNNGSFSSVQPNLAVKVQATTPDVLREGITFVSRRSTVDDHLTDSDVELYNRDVQIDASDLRASINIKTHFVDDLDDASMGSDIRTTFAVIREPSLFISDVYDHGTGTYGSPKGRRLPNTPVISVTIEGSGLRKMNTEVTSAFHPIQTSNGSLIIDDPICVFWDFEANNGTGDWSDYGCSLLQNVTYITNSTAIMCTCNHTTNFAVIMNFHSPKPSVHFQRASKYLSYIGCGLSIVSLIMTLAVYVLSPKLRQKQPNQIFMNICLSLLFLYIAYILVVIFTRKRIDVAESNEDIDIEKDVEIWCHCLAAMIQYFTLTSLVWMAVEGVNMYLLFVRVLNARIPGFITKASLIAWGIPVIAVAITGGIARHNYVDPNMCFLAKMPKIGGLLCPIGVIIIANIIIFTLVIIRLGRTIRKSSAKRDSIILRAKEGQQRLQKAICIFLLLGLTWSSGYFLLIGTAFNQVFQIIFIILNSFQGFFIFVIYCLRQRVVRAELSRLCGCGRSSKRRSISIASSSKREDTMKTRQTEMPSTTIIGPSFDDIELNISDAEDAEGPLNRGTIRTEWTESRQGRSDQETRPASSADPVQQRRSKWLSFTEMRDHLEVVLSKGKRNRKHKEVLSSECWAAGQQDKHRSLQSRDK